MIEFDKLYRLFSAYSVNNFKGCFNAMANTSHNANLAKPMNDTNPKIMGTKRAAELTGLSKSYIASLCRKGIIKATQDAVVVHGRFTLMI